MNFSSYDFDSPRDWGQIGKKFGTKHFIIQKVNKFHIEKGYLF